ncbi:MAG: MerR family transcriptional regulator [Clostridiales bacterium]|nr:MerR family transcriptional regulator [Clostridiales bacterium]
MLYTIGEMAKTLGLPTSTLRFYDKKGLLPFMERSSGGMRMFSDKDIECLRIVECLKQSGLSLDDIRHFIRMTTEGDSTIDERLAMFLKRKSEVEAQIEAMQKTLETIKYKCWFYETAKAAGTTSVPASMGVEQIPQEFRKAKERLTCK